MSFWGYTVIGIFSLSILFMLIKILIEYIWNRRLNVFKIKAHIAPTKMPVRRYMKYGYSFVLSAAIIAITIISGLNLTPFSPEPPLLMADKTLVNATRVGSAMKLNQLIETYNTSNNYDFWESPSSAVDESLDSTSRDYTDTNVQIEGVNEGDVLKTDGYRVFYAPRYYNVIEVLDVEDNHEMTHVDSMTLDGFRVDSLYLTDEYLIVLGYTYEEVIYPMDTLNVYYGFYFSRQTASIVVFDKDTLEEAYRLETDLSFIDHRVIDDTLYLVSRKWFYDDASLRPMFEIYMDGESERSYLDYEDMYYFDDMPSQSMTVITSLNLDSFTTTSQGFLGETANIYVTETSIYTFNSRHQYIETVEGYIIDRSTSIVKYHINDATNTIEYVASIKIDGIVEDRYWLDESGDYLRVVTSRGWSGEEPNRLYILEENNEQDTFDQIALMDEQIGHENERVESVRFHGDYVNIVTYEQMDPLYTIDLSDPNEPIIMNTPIEEAGYSEYMHIWDQDNHVLGLGYLDANADSRIDGMKLSAYDTDDGTILDSDPYPYEDASTWSYSYTEAMYNPKALMVDVELGLFGFPMVAYQYNTADWGYHYQTSFVVYQIDFNRENVLGDPIIIEHETTNWYNQIDRGIYINGFIYTFSAHQIASYNLGTQMPFETIYIDYEEA